MLLSIETTYEACIHLPSYLRQDDIRATLLVHCAAATTWTSWAASFDTTAARLSARYSSYPTRRAAHSAKPCSVATRLTRGTASRINLRKKVDGLPCDCGVRVCLRALDQLDSSANCTCKSDARCNLHFHLSSSVFPVLYPLRCITHSCGVVDHCVSNHRNIGKANDHQPISSRVIEYIPDKDIFYTECVVEG